MQRIFTEKRPWGEFRQYTTGEPVTVKTLVVKAGERISLQQHELRSEFWRVLSGTPRITVGEKVFEAAKGDEIQIPSKTTHRIEALAAGGDVEILEIAEGTFDENDITRFEDSYGRAPST